jgi:hypothetical protein
MVRARTAVLLLLVLCLSGCGRGGGGRKVEDMLPSSKWRALRGSYSPDGTRLAFLGTPENDPTDHLVVSDGKRERDLTPEGGIEGFAWMPDSRTLLAAQADEKAEGSHLLSITLEGKADRLPLERAVSIAGGLVVLPDGERVIVSAAPPSKTELYEDLFEIELATGKFRALTNTPDLGERFPTLAEDGRVVFSAGVSVSESNHANGWIGIIDPDGSVRRLTPPDQTAMSATVSTGAAAKVLYSAFPGEDRARTALWEVDLAGGPPRLVLDVDIQYPELLPQPPLRVIGLVNHREDYRLEVVALP